MLTNDNKRKCVEAALEYLQAYETYGQEFLDLLSLEARLGCTIWHQKRRNNLVSGNVQGHRSLGSLNKLSADKLMASIF
ncbi:hypothetical protein TNCT_285521 [Trichonephila clavata]|uniref:Uncharacterized protein n=1 Tax=Trichonephila clavata TaxID=2740835 RepID=A0A8X6HF98_TRICU|nr:hypothetical protein TNCT_285521 [Trichonephila clavata]